MNGDIDDRLSHGKNLLQKYRSKIKESNSTNALMTTHSDADRLSMHSTSRKDDSCSETTHGGSSRESSRPPSFCHERLDEHANERTDNSGYFTNKIGELQKKVSEKQATLDETMKKLQAIHKHYSELHQAYTQVCELKFNNTSSGVPAEYSDQIKQLHTALSIAINEKTLLQSELRKAQDRVRVLDEEYRFLGDTNKELRSIANCNTNRLKELEKQNISLQKSIANQSSQVDKYRRECSEFEAKILMVLQDKRDIQARFKHTAEQKTLLENELKVVKNELNMKNIYIKQFSNGSSNTQPTEFLETINTLKDNTRQLESTNEANRLEISQLNNRLAEERQRHEQSSHDYITNVTRLRTEVDQLKTIRRELESSKNFLEEELRVLRNNYEAHISAAQKNSQNEQFQFMENSAPVPSIDQAELEKLKNTAKYFENLAFEYNANICALKNILEQKDICVEEQKASLFASLQKIQQLEDEKNVRSDLDENVLLLAEQLQNEKATVSRAVSQNRELKSQLIELQDRIVQVTNESASKEDERLTALHTIKMLQEQIHNITTAAVEIPEKAVEAQPNIQDQHIIRNTPNMSAQNQTVIVDDHEVPSESIEQGNYNELNHLNTPVIIGSSEILNAVSSSATDNPILATPILSESAMNQKEEFVIASEDQQFSDNAASPSIDTQPLSSAEKISQSPPSLNTAEKAKDKYAEGHDSSNCQDATNDDVRMLSERLDRLVQENQQFRLSNDRLQYWLTALESENESIGEYIALYRFQRSSIQTRLSEKEKHLTRLQETHSVLLNHLNELKEGITRFTNANSGFCGPQKITQESENSIVEQPKASNEDSDSNNQTMPSKGCNSLDADTESSVFTDFQELSNIIEKCNMLISTDSILNENAYPKIPKNEAPQCSGCLECRGDFVTL